MSKELELAYLLAEKNFKEFKNLRVLLGLRVKEIAYVLNISEAAVSQKLIGKLRISNEQLMAIDKLCLNKKQQLNQRRENTKC